MIRVLQTKESLQILSKNYIGNLSYIFSGRPFIAPITYFFDTKENVIIGYSSEGHKINAMRENKEVCFNVSEIDSVSSWKSIVAQGIFKELSGSMAKASLQQFSQGVKGLIKTSNHKSVDFINEFSSRVHSDEFPIIFHIQAYEISGKMRANSTDKF